MRTILHCDLNNFFASVECVKNPLLKNSAVAVCGSVKDRHGIVLAKNEIAKSYGVNTAEPIWLAMKKCKNLVTVPPNMSHYQEFSKKAFEIYTRYTDVVEPFGIDECWLDITNSLRLFGGSENIAFSIKETIKNELGLTISVGISFNKIFAKLGSDMEKPDAITIITRENFKAKIYDLPCCEMLGVGNATNKKLSRYYIKTIGQLAQTSPEFLQEKFGVVGIQLWENANGINNDEVKKVSQDVKSIGKSTTLSYDLTDNNSVWKTLYTLSQGVCEQLREQNLSAGGICISIKTTDLITKEFQRNLAETTSSSLEFCKAGYDIFIENFEWEKDIRAIGIRAISLQKYSKPIQYNIFEDIVHKEKIVKLEKTMDSLKNKYGKRVVLPSSILSSTKI